MCGVYEREKERDSDITCLPRAVCNSGSAVTPTSFPSEQLVSVCCWQISAYDCTFTFKFKSKKHQLFIMYIMLFSCLLQVSHGWHKLPTDRFDPDFIERRRIGLEVGHSVLLFSTVVDCIVYISATEKLDLCIFMCVTHYHCRWPAMLYWSWL